MDNIKALGIEKYFETIIVSEWEGIKKLEPQIFKKALMHLNISPYESMYVEEHTENDVKAAQKLGMKGIWKKDLQWGNIETDFIIDDLAELPLIVENVSMESS